FGKPRYDFARCTSRIIRPLSSADEGASRGATAVRRRSGDGSLMCPITGAGRQGLLASQVFFPALRRVVHKGWRSPSQLLAALWTPNVLLLFSVNALGGL